MSTRLSFERRLKRLGIEQSVPLSSKEETVGRYKGLPFYIWNRAEHIKRHAETNGLCCFNHALPVGMPKKNGQLMPLFPYEQTIYDALMMVKNEKEDIQKDKHVYVLKAVGLGVTEFCLRWIAWMCLRNNELKGTQIVIITAPSILIATGLIKRMKALFPNVSFAEKETDVTLNGVTIRAFPSHTGLDSARGLEKPSIILIDESDFAPVSLVEDIREIAERYISKSNPYIILVSTPNAPEGLMEQISKEPEDTCIYKRLYLDYTVGVGLIYSDADIAASRASPSWRREMELSFIGLEGDVFSHASIQSAIDNELLLQSFMHPSVRNIDPIAPSYQKAAGVDAAFGGSSKFAVCVVQLVPPGQHGPNPLLQVIHSQEDSRPDFDEKIDELVRMKKTWGISKFFIDSANPEVIASLKTGIGERPDFETQITRLKSVHRYVRDDPVRNLPRFMNVIPVSFASEGRSALSRTRIMLDRGWLAIDPSRHHKLLVALRTAKASDSMLLDKSVTSHDDLLDSLRLALLNWSVS